ncbi:endonuclease III [bacterium]|nr:endonuclease III [bacterium]
MDDLENRKIRAVAVVELLKKEFPAAQCRLTFNSPLELLIKTILSAQCTDERVNTVGESLFRKYISAKDFAQASVLELEKDIRPTGFFRNKARNIQSCCRQLIERHCSEVPSTMNELIALPGVGRKTANVILGTIFNIPAVVVDTHVIRISRLLKLTTFSDPEKIESDIMTILPQHDWISFAHLMSEHGRKTCIARRPACHACVLVDHCPSSLI